MENTLLIGLSRQMTLERQIDVVANNVANVNTSGYKADRSLFQEFLTSGAHEDNFLGRDGRVSSVQDRATFHDFSQGPTEETKNPLDVAIDGGGFLVVQTPAGARYTRDGGLQINNPGHVVTASAEPKSRLDVAIDGGGFLVVQTPAGERYTRDGGLQINNQGQLVTAGGNPVLGTSGPIVFPPTDHDIRIAAAGHHPGR